MICLGRHSKEARKLGNIPGGACAVSHMSYSLNSLKRVMWGIVYGTAISVTKTDTSSLDDGSSEQLTFSLLGVAFYSVCATAH